ncbi:hypothetical protein HYQ44_017442 [Verticillium longisporum]|nr:hypothetical protein HYQ44_017442 [Verticillium longisporum]
MENRNGDRVVPIPAEGPGQRPSPHSRFVTIVPNFTGRRLPCLSLSWKSQVYTAPQSMVEGFARRQVPT